MFHTPSISCVEKQAKVMGLPLITQATKGEKEAELSDLEAALKKAKSLYQIEGLVTGALASSYQAERIDKICKKLGLKCLNPLWGMGQLKLLQSLLKDKFQVIITGVAAYPLDSSFLGREITPAFIQEVKTLQDKYKINPDKHVPIPKI